MPRSLHTFLRILIPGGIILVETLLLYVFVFQPFPGDSDVWNFLSKEWGKTTGFTVLAIVLGWAYYGFGLTHTVDDKIFRGMEGIRKNIVRRLTAPFKADNELAPKLDRLDWRAVKRVFFQFIDELPALKTSNELAFLSGLGFYSFIDLGTISTVIFVISALSLIIQRGGSPLALRLFTLALAVIVPLSIFGARIAINKHQEISNRQLDAVLSDQLPELRDRLLRCVTVY